MVLNLKEKECSISGRSRCWSSSPTFQANSNEGSSMLISFRNKVTGILILYMSIVWELQLEGLNLGRDMDRF